LAEAQAEVVGFTHADLQCPPESFLSAWTLYERVKAEGPCLIKGRRRGSRPWLDQGVSWLFNHLTEGLLGVRAVQKQPPARARC